MNLIKTYKVNIDQEFKFLVDSCPSMDIWTLNESKSDNNKIFLNTDNNDKLKIEFISQSLAREEFNTQRAEKYFHILSKLIDCGFKINAKAYIFIYEESGVIKKSELNTYHDFVSAIKGPVKIKFKYSKLLRSFTRIPYPEFRIYVKESHANSHTVVGSATNDLQIAIAAANREYERVTSTDYELPPPFRFNATLFKKYPIKSLSKWSDNKIYNIKATNSIISVSVLGIGVLNPDGTFTKSRDNPGNDNVWFIIETHSSVIAYKDNTYYVLSGIKYLRVKHESIDLCLNIHDEYLIKYAISEWCTENIM